MIFFFLFLALICTPSLANPISQDMLNSLINEIQKVAALNPQNANQYIQNVKAFGNFNSDSFPLSCTNSILKNRWQMSDQIIRKFNAIFFSDNLGFQTFTETLDPKVASLDEFVGTARRNGDNAEIAFIKVFSSGK